MKNYEWHYRENINEIFWFSAITPYMKWDRLHPKLLLMVELCTRFDRMTPFDNDQTGAFRKVIIGPFSKPHRSLQLCLREGAFLSESERNEDNTIRFCAKRNNQCHCGIQNQMSSLVSKANSSMKYAMMTSSNENIFRVTGPLCGDSPVSDEFPSERPVARNFDIFFDLRLNQRLSKQSKRQWFMTSL